MSNPENLPARENQQPEIVPHIPEERPREKILDVTEQRYILDNSRLIVYGEDAVHIMPLDPKEKQTFEHQGTHYTRKEKVATIGGYTSALGASILRFSQDIPAEVALSGLAGGTVLVGGAFAHNLLGTVTRILRTNKIVRGAASNAEALTTADRSIAFTLPRTALDATVSFNSEMGISQTTVGELAPRTETFPGLHIQEGTDQINGSVHPWKMYQTALNLFDDLKARDAFVEATWTAFLGVHQAAQRMPKNGLDNRAPESIRSVHTTDMEQFAIGALTAFGAIRAQYAPILSNRLRDFYAMRESADADVLDDAAMLDTPTTHNLSWKYIESFSRVFAK